MANIFEPSDGFMCYMFKGGVIDNKDLAAMDIFLAGKKMYPFYIIGFYGDIHKYQALVDMWMGVEFDDR